METTRLVREALDWDLPPERAALLVRDDPHPFALLGDWAGGRAVIGSAPIRVAQPDEDPFKLLDDQPLMEPGGSGAVGGGWFGRLGFGLSSRIEKLHPPPPRPVPLSDFALAFYDHVLICDAAGRWWFEALATPARAAAVRARRAELDARARARPAPRPYSTSAWRAVPGPDGHAIAVAACRERIHAGDLFQASLTLRLEAGLAGDPIDLFAQGAGVLRPPRAAYCAGPWGAVASLSPELFLRRRGREVLTAPIKGTRPLGERDALVGSARTVPRT
jgi:para-aminobenzoate synthetase/4-amino-4-deoxychorismate lyase